MENPQTEIFNVATVIYEAWKVRPESDPFYLHMDKFAPYPNANDILHKLEKDYRVIHIAAEPYDKDNEHDKYLGLDAESIANKLFVGEITPRAMDYVNTRYLSYGIIIEPGFEKFYSDIKMKHTEKKHQNVITNETKKPDNVNDRQKIRYDKNSQQLTYGKYRLEITGPIQHEVCKQIFKNRKKIIEYNDIIEVVDVTSTIKSRAIYDAVNNINGKIEKTFDLNKVLTTKAEKVWISKKYL